MKFDRFMDAEVVQFQVLSEDYRKMVFLQADRHVEFHASYGKHYRTRIPKHGRDLTYFSPAAEVYVVGSSSDIYRLNLEEGKFMSPLASSSDALNAIGCSPATGLIVTAGEDGNIPHRIQDL